MDSLSIRIVEFRDVGSEKSMFGYLARYGEDEAAYEVADSLEGFRKEFPTIESLIDGILEEQAFSHLNIEYCMVGGYPEVSNQEDEDSASIYLMNAHQVY